MNILECMRNSLDRLAYRNQFCDTAKIQYERPRLYLFNENLDEVLDSLNQSESSHQKSNEYHLDIQFATKKDVNDYLSVFNAEILKTFNNQKEEAKAHYRKFLKEGTGNRFFTIVSWANSTSYKNRSIWYNTFLPIESLVIKAYVRNCALVHNNDGLLVGLDTENIISAEFLLKLENHKIESSADYIIKEIRLGNCALSHY